MADPRTHVFTNNAASLLDVGIDDNDTAIHVTAGTGALFPSPTAGKIFKITLQNLTTGEIEICNCTARSSDTLTVERGQEGTTAIAWAAGVLVHHRATAETFERFEEFSGSGGTAAANITYDPSTSQLYADDVQEALDELAAEVDTLQEPVIIQLACSDLTSNLVAGTNKAYFRAPKAFTLMAVRASLLIASTYGAIIIDVNKNGVSILSTKLTVDEDEKTSLTATPPVISDSAIGDDDIISIDFDAVELDARGVIVTLIGHA